MNDEHRAHRDRIIATIRGLVINKYRKGVEEHGGNLWDMTPLLLVENAIEEAIDQLTYLITLRENMLKPVMTVEQQQELQEKITRRSELAYEARDSARWLCPEGGSHVFVLGPGGFECTKCAVTYGSLA